MRHSRGIFGVAALFGFALFSAAVVAAENADDGFVCLFDGKTLDGWEGKTQFWSVRDGAITGQTTADNPTKGNTFLIWRGGRPGDFELRLKFRIVGGNSGIQYRSTEYDDFVVGGYQADFEAGDRYIGILYEERGRGILALRGQKVTIGEDGKKEVSGPTCDEKEMLASLQKEGWNEYLIIAKGNHLVQKINGFTTVDVTDNQTEKSRAEGVLALQLHAGPPMLVQFKEIQLKLLK
jgi:hypothetical protein